MRVDEQRHFGVQIAKRGKRRERNQHKIADAAHIHEHLIRSFVGERPRSWPIISSDY